MSLKPISTLIPKHLKIIATVYDSKAEAYLRPFFAENIATAMRAFSESAQDPSSQFSRHPGDFTLFVLGTWDEQKGAIELMDAHINLGTAVQFQNTEVA